MIYFLIYLFFEVIVSVNIASAIGSLATFFEIIGSALLGFIILINFKTTLRENLMSVSCNQMDLREFQNLNLFTIFGAILLIIPGFLTDIIGLLLQFSVFTTMLVNRYSIKFGKHDQMRQKKNSTQKDNDVIDVEIISDNSLTK